MKLAGSGFEPCDNAQARVDTESMRILAPPLTQTANDEERVEAMLAHIEALPQEIQPPERLLADSGFYSERKVECCRAAGIEPLIALGHGGHYPDWYARFEEAAPLERPACPAEQMKHTLKTRTGRAACALGKQTVGPVFSIIGDEIPSVHATWAGHKCATNGHGYVSRGT